MSVSTWSRMRGPIAAAAAVVLMLAAPALAQSDDGGGATSPYGLSATVGAQGYIDPNSAVTVVVDLDASQLLVGTVQARMGRATAETAVEVPAGSAKRYTLELPAPGMLRQVVIKLIPEGADEQSLSLRMTVPTEDLLVGLLDADEAAGVIRAATTSPLGRTPVVVTLDATDLSAALAVVPYVVAGPGAIDRLDDAPAAAVSRWLERGGRLYAPAADLDRFAEIGGGVPLPGGSAVVSAAGAGEVGAIADPADLLADDWSVILRDVPPIGLVRDYTRQNTDDALLAAATAGQGANVPALPWLLGGIVLFVVLVGPVNFLALRATRRPQLAWVTVPMLSVVFAAGFWVIGTGQIKDFTVGHASVVVDAGAGGLGHAVVTLQTESGGEHTMTFPEGWSAALVDASVSGGSDERTVTVETEDLGVVTAGARWSAEDAGVAITTALEPPDTITATAVNDGTGSYWAWGIVIGGKAVGAADPLEPGGSGSVSLVPGRSSSPYDPVLANAALRSGYPGGGYDDADYQSVYQLAAVAEALVPDLRGTTAYWYGFTRDGGPRIGVDGDEIRAAGPGLLVRRISLDDATFAALGRAMPSLLAVEGASTIEGYYGEVYAYGATSVVFRYSLSRKPPSTVKASPGFTVLDTVEAYNWTLGEYVPVAWSTDIPTAGIVSVSGEVVLRASRDEGDRSFDESLQLDRFALTWSTS